VQTVKIIIFIHVQFLSVVTPYSVVVEYQHFGGPGCLHLQGKVIGNLSPSHFTSDSQSIHISVEPLLGLMTRC